MLNLFRSKLFLPMVTVIATTTSTSLAQEAKLKALLVAGGCCHDYAAQHKILFEGIQARANVQVDVFWSDDKTTTPPLPLYDDPDWAKGYDVIIHDECAAGNKDVDVLNRILDAHKTIPAVHLHCAMHSFRTGTDAWFKHLGLQSTGHGPQLPIDIQFADKAHPITATLGDWTTGREELYNNRTMFDAHPVATGTQIVNGEERTAVVAWTNEKQGARSFSTTIGHNNSTVADPRYLELVTRGLLWACGKLDHEHLQPYTGENEITFVPKPDPKRAVQTKQPKDATLVAVTASSTQNERYTWMAIDGNMETRWCAANDSKPQWLQLEFDAPQEITGVDIVWESLNNVYGYKLEASLDGKSWTLLHDATNSEQKGNTSDKFAPANLKFLRLTGVKSSGGWISLWELKVTGKGIKSIFPMLDTQTTAMIERREEFKDSGNIPPKIVKLSAAEEAEILKDAKVPEGFEKTLFAPWQAANYPVYVAASPSGDLYVSSDGNGSLGRNPHRGRVLRLRDTDGDGRADEVTEFVKDIDSPRGLVWDHDRLYLLHPPHITVFHDRDGDGVAEDSKRLITGVAFGFKDRPADHTTNGLELGMDGWIYIAGGDFGFLEAIGTDGRKLQHRGGGVIRFRPDGSGLELFATGTRNILGTPMSPLLDMFARDNTNDGGGWDVRFHHFTGLEDHGYPRLYKNFGDEHVHPLADYGGGSGCGSVYIHEPGFPEKWNQAPFTADWGRAALFKHTVKREGATFLETKKPELFIQVTRPTDADVDGMSRVYLASWKGPATFNWAGAEQGYIVRVSPKGYEPEPLPEFSKLSDAELIELLESPSHIRALTAQRALLRREVTPEISNLLLALANDSSKELRARIAALYAISQRGTDSRASERVIKLVSPLTTDATMQPFVLRALGDMGLDQLTHGDAGPSPAQLFVTGLKSNDPRTRLESMIAAARQRRLASATAIAANLGHEDPVLAHTAFQSLALLDADEACFAVLDSPNATSAQRTGAAYALMRMHRVAVVDTLIDRLTENPQPKSRQPILAALCRLYHREAEWTGQSWGTRPDTRGPYYDLTTWEASERILAALQAALATAESADAAALVSEMNRNRIRSSDALDRIIKLASADKTLVATAIAQLAAAEDIPNDAVPLLLRAATDQNTPAMILAECIAALAKLNRPEAIEASLTALVLLDQSEGENKAQAAGRQAFFQNSTLPDQTGVLESIAVEDPKSPEARWANGSLLDLATRKDMAPEAQAKAAAAIDRAWLDPERRIQLMNVAGELRNHYLDDRISAAMNDFDEEIASAAKSAGQRLRIQPPGDDTTPKIGSLPPDQALAQVVTFKGNRALGEAVFLRAACATCHTTSQDQEQKGPYLGNIADTYRRNDLAESILDPNKTIAQGFATAVITTKDDFEFTGFVTNEAGNEVTLRDVAAQEHTIKKSEITQRGTLPTSLMPPGLMDGFSVKEMASLLDYLEGLAKK